MFFKYMCGFVAFINFLDFLVNYLVKNYSISQNGSTVHMG